MTDHTREALARLKQAEHGRDPLDVMQGDYDDRIIAAAHVHALLSISAALDRIADTRERRP